MDPQVQPLTIFTFRSYVSKQYNDPNVFKLRIRPHSSVLSEKTRNLLADNPHVELKENGVLEVNPFKQIPEQLLEKITLTESLTVEEDYLTLDFKLNDYFPSEIVISAVVPKNAKEPQPG